METEIGVMWLQSKEYLEPLEARRGKKGSLLELLEGVWPCQHLAFRLVSPRTVRPYISAILSPRFVVILLQPWEVTEEFTEGNAFPLSETQSLPSHHTLATCSLCTLKSPRTHQKPGSRSLLMKSEKLLLRHNPGTRMILCRKQIFFLK